MTHYLGFNIGFKKNMWYKWSLQGVVTLSCCVFIVFNQSCQSKVGDLTDEFMRHQNIGGSQVSVDVIPLLNEGHAVSHLQGAARHQKSPIVCLKCRSVRELPMFQYCVIFVCVGQMKQEDSPTRGVYHFPRSGLYTPNSCTPPTQSTQLRSSASSTSWYLKLQSCLYLTADWLIIPVAVFFWFNQRLHESFPYRQTTEGNWCYT